VSGPSSFIGGGSYRPAPTGAQHPPALPRCVPTLSVCAGGLVNLNAEASALLFGLATGVCLHQPPKVRAGRQPQPWELSAGACRPLLRRADQVRQLRFWVPVAECPPVGRYLLAPTASDSKRFVLVPH
jgi:hypothetical protein